MKKFLIVCLCVALLACFASVNTVAVAETTDYQNSPAFLFLQEFLTACPARYGAAEELVAATFLKQKFDDVLQQVAMQSQIVAFGEGESAGYNVVAQLRSTNLLAQTVVVGAHYDATGMGANDNAAGVAALYLAMQQLVLHAAQLPFNVTFVAFGGEERGLLGSQSFVGSLSSAEKQDILLAFNVDVIVNGDNLYLFCENQQTDIADFILQNASEGANIKEKPHAKGVYSFLDVYGYGYYESVQGSDHTPFRLEGIPTAMFFSGNYVAWDYVESIVDEKNNMNTNSDTLENLQKYNGSLIVQRIEAVAGTVCNTLVNDQFVAVAQNAREQLVNNALWFNTLWPKIILVGVLACLAIGAWAFYRKLQKQSILGNAEIKNSKVFSTPQAEDVFSFDDTQKDDVDDVFQFKK